MSAGRGFSWKSGARVGFPRWRSVAGIELALAVVIVGAAAASLIGGAHTMLAKVRMVDTLSMMHVGRIAVVEHYAITGRALETDMFGREGRAESSATPEYERHLSASAAFAAVASASGQQGSKSAWLEDTSGYYSRAGVLDGSVVGIGRLRGFRDTYRMSFAPADRAGGGPVLLWSCGSASPPAGYMHLGARVPDHINPQLMIHPCRTSRPW